jgi:hypothetical protein
VGLARGCRRSPSDGAPPAIFCSWVCLARPAARAPQGAAPPRARCLSNALLRGALQAGPSTISRSGARRPRRRSRAAAAAPPQPRRRSRAAAAAPRAGRCGRRKGPSGRCGVCWPPAKQVLFVSAASPSVRAGAPHRRAHKGRRGEKGMGVSGGQLHVTPASRTRGVQASAPLPPPVSRRPAAGQLASTGGSATAGG